MVRKLDVLEFTSIGRHRIKLAIMTEQHVASPRSIPFCLIALAGWINHHQYQVIDYLREENRLLREQLGERRLRFNDDQRRRLAAKAKALGHRLMKEMTPIVTWETLLTWHRKLIAQNYDGSGRRAPGRPRNGS
jgi:hypothetical protein